MNDFPLIIERRTLDGQTELSPEKVFSGLNSVAKKSLLYEGVVFLFRQRSDLGWEIRSQILDVQNQSTPLLMVTQIVNRSEEIQTEGDCTEVPIKKEVVRHLHPCITSKIFNPMQPLKKGVERNKVRVINPEQLPHIGNRITAFQEEPLGANRNFLITGLDRAEASIGSPGVISQNIQEHCNHQMHKHP